MAPGKELAPFEGFPADLPDFLWGIALNNEKPWFEARRDIYERCLHGPVKALAYGVCAALAERFPDIPLTPHISRIYRDVRTLNGRGPLNDHMWFSLGRTGRVYATEPQFFFGVAATQCDWGVGFWNADTAMMERWRAAIDANPQRLSRIVRKINRLEGFEMTGPVYKRPKGDPGALLYPWYNARRVVVQKVIWNEPAPPGPALLDTLTDDFAALMPLYEYLLTIQ